MAVAIMELSPHEREHWSAQRLRPGIGVAGQIQITWDALKAVRERVDSQKQTPATEKVSSVLGAPIPFPPVPASPTSEEIDPTEYFGFPAKFDSDEMQSIFGFEIRSHSSDGTPLSVYFGPTRINMLADAAIQTYGEAHANAIQFVAKTVIDAYMANF